MTRGQKIKKALVINNKKKIKIRTSNIAVTHGYVV